MEIIVKDVVKCFGPTTVLDHINLSLHGGRIYGLQGINGCGKTMLMRLIAGLIYPTQGEVLVNGKTLRGRDCFPENMGLMIENPAFLAGYSGFENLSLLADVCRKITGEQVKQAMCRVGLEPGDKKKYRKYSLGMKQRLGIACAIMECPELLILDEPFLALDEEAIAMVAGIIREERDRGALVIMACHDYEMLSGIADEIFRITAGKITWHMVRNASGKFDGVA